MTPCPICNAPMQGHPDAGHYAEPFVAVACWCPVHGYRPVPSVRPAYEALGGSGGSHSNDQA